MLNARTAYSHENSIMGVVGPPTAVASGGSGGEAEGADQGQQRAEACTKSSAV